MSADLVVVAIQLAGRVRGSHTVLEVANRAAVATSAMCCQRQFFAFMRWRAHINRRYDELRADPEEWASYAAEARLTDNVAGETLPGAQDEYPEHNQ